MTAAARFTTPNTDALRARGLNGDLVTVSHTPGLIALAGSDGGVLQLPLADIVRFRPASKAIGVATSWTTHVWLKDGDFELAGDADLFDYALFVRAVGAELLAANPHGQLRMRSEFAGVSAMTVVFALMTAVLMWLGYLSWRRGDADWYMFIVPLSVPLAVMMVFLMPLMQVADKRAVVRVEDLERGVPDIAGLQN